MKKIFILYLILIYGFLWADNWKIKIKLIAPGTRSEGKRGELFYKGISLPPSASRIITQDGKEYFYKEPLYMWSDAGWKMKKSKYSIKNITREVKLLSPLELKDGFYYGDYYDFKKGTPKSWVWMNNKLYKVWIKPELIPVILGIKTGDKKLYWIEGKEMVKVIWRKKIFIKSVVKDEIDTFTVVGTNNQDYRLYKISKRDGKILANFLLPSGISFSKLNSGFTLSNNFLFYYTGIMKTGKFNVYSLKNNKVVFSMPIYFTHYAPIVMKDGLVYLAYSEADHKFSHLYCMAVGGTRLWELKTRESIVQFAPLINDKYIVFFTEGAIYGLKRT